MDTGQLYEQLQPKLREIRNYLIRLGASSSDAEDIVQETVYKAFLYIDSIENGKFSAWLYKVAINHLEMTKMIKKAKRKSTIRSVVISLMVTVFVLFGAMIGNVQLVNWSSSRAMNDEWMMEEISGPNLAGTGYTDEQGLLSGILEFHKVKVIEGVPIPWPSKKVDYQVIPFFAFAALGGSSTEPGITLPDAEMKKEGYEYTRAYNSANGQRKMLFYIPQVDYNGKILNDLSLLQDMDQNKLVEMAISFDRDYTLSELKQMIPGGLTQTWYWVDT
ncbi:sigma factor regulator N-terminal domain-containing protein [Paenibacillus lentus]|uniref:Sigma-70 family RNA polymerase sigma factor n=1 Tax=Paenibacillus lentus TaxID=1338368 RepID=A0A3S8RYB6_9BACL|nr:sigma factor regulator N-terminal domain-containing protein [Paenibacillus lentus]AZK47911.1 hypothetical protein EIM92_18505 [Paenibacillus lentus]